MGGDHGNFINGRWRAAGPGEGFVVAGPMGEELTRRPRSTAHELEEALGVLEGSSQAWWERAASERVEAVRAMDIVGALGDGAGALGVRLGLDEAGALGLLSEDLGKVEALESIEVSGPGVALVRAAPTALFSGLTPLIESALSRGWCVLLLADPTLPWLAEAVARAWSVAGGEAGALALLHDDGATTARSVLGSGQLVGVLARDHEARLGELQAALSPSRGKGFGAGVVDPGRPSTSFEGFAVRDATAAVTSDLDPEEEAEKVCEAAFGAALALGGERDGSLGRVVCHEAHFSAFTRGFLERFDALESAYGPLNRHLQA
ncbi:MAG: hypothetical protein MK291_11090, partial [Planctomycetes bacterium]|nr:hypothetical protein [Planctomycetota bacterium]